MREFNDILGQPDQQTGASRIVLKNKKIDLDEIQSLDTKVIGEHKAREAYKVMKSPVLVDDTELEFEALGGLPGPFIKWFVDVIGPAGLTKLLKGFSNRKALSRCTVTYFDGKEIKFFEGVLKGSIALKPLGTGGFGYDSIFIPDFKIGKKQNAKTFAQLGEKGKNQVSHRKLAIEKLKKFLVTLK